MNDAQGMVVSSLAMFESDLVRQLRPICDLFCKGGHLSVIWPVDLHLQRASSPQGKRTVET